MNYPAEEFSYGKPNRPGTPINGVISNHYGDAAHHEIQEKYEMKYELVRILTLALITLVVKIN